MHFPLCPPILFIHPNSRETFPAATHHHAHIHSGASCADTRVEYGFSFPLFFAELTLLHHPPSPSPDVRTNNVDTRYCAHASHTKREPWKTNPPINRFAVKRPYLLYRTIVIRWKCCTAQNSKWHLPPPTCNALSRCSVHCAFFDHTNSHYTHSNTHDSGVVVACHLVAAAAAAAKLFFPTVWHKHTHIRSQKRARISLTAVIITIAVVAASALRPPVLALVNRPVVPARDIQQQLTVATVVASDKVTVVVVVVETVLAMQWCRNNISRLPSRSVRTAWARPSWRAGSSAIMAMVVSMIGQLLFWAASSLVRFLREWVDTSRRALENLGHRCIKCVIVFLFF